LFRVGVPAANGIASTVALRGAASIGIFGSFWLEASARGKVRFLANPFIVAIVLLLFGVWLWRATPARSWNFEQLQPTSKHPQIYARLESIAGFCVVIECHAPVGSTVAVLFSIKPIGALGGLLRCRFRGMLCIGGQRSCRFGGRVNLRFWIGKAPWVVLQDGVHNAGWRMIRLGAVTVETTAPAPARSKGPRVALRRLGASITAVTVEITARVTLAVESTATAPTRSKGPWVALLPPVFATRIRSLMRSLLAKKLENGAGGGWNARGW